MATLKAPFNFVPLNKKPYIPSWSDRISHDIPFSDALSGTLRITITSQSPIFISDEMKEGDNPIQEFCHTKDGRYFIPGTSIKGVLRNVMEILSFGKMSQVQNQCFGIRDLDDRFFYRKKININNVKCGWLRYEGERYLLTSCGKPWRISPESIDKYYGTNLTEYIKGDNFKDDFNRTAMRKYEMFKNYSLSGVFTNDTSFMDNENFQAGGRIIKRFANDGEEGKLVFTGQPGQRKAPRGKYFEFIFPAKVENENIIVSNFVMQSFETVHSESPDYKDFRKKQLREGKEIPVFFTIDSNGNVEAIGLSYMFKYPAYNSIYSAIPDGLLFNKPDLCECVFGYTSKGDSLKGRVQFTSAFLQDDPKFSSTQTIALAKPHPSYYPLYLGKGQTWNSPKVEIAGRKRYPIRNQIENNVGTESMCRTIMPLDKGMVFHGEIHFHNLRPIELGALVLSIEFCKYHSFGQGKPLGYGKTTISIENANVCTLNSQSFKLDDAKESFENEMENQFHEWKNSQQLSELKKMAEGIPVNKDALFTYMKMDTDVNRNEFKMGKKDYNEGYQLGTFSQIISESVPKAECPQNVSPTETRKDIEKEAEKQRQKKLEEKLLQEERRAIELKRQKYEQLIDEAQHLYIENQWDDAIMKAEEAKKVFPDEVQHDAIIVNCMKSKETAVYRKKEQEEKAKKFSQPFAAIIKGKTSAGNLVGTMESWLKISGNYFGETEYLVLLEEAKKLTPKEQKKMKNKRQNLLKAIGDKLTEKLFNDLSLL